MIENKLRLAGKLTYANVSDAIDAGIGDGLVGMDVILWIAALFNPLFLIDAIPNSIFLYEWNKGTKERRIERERELQKLKCNVM
ncbi:hypothetical protein ACFVS2_20740 [Brevibacillus sp. NPDC058079]|uniref:hypothetical protein n=1 Tax=Brevibacillus sp. NPDC058079 TaxID=3346330 RepID=UPI0036E37A34